jgi:excinuclease UvrABC helicase subunit UvrB
MTNFFETKETHNARINVNDIIGTYSGSKVRKSIIEYNGKYYIEENIIKDILQKEFERHTQEMTQHRKQFEENKSKKQKDKMIKHLHKRFEVGYIAKQLGFKVCECGRIY